VDVKLAQRIMFDSSEEPEKSLDSAAAPSGCLLMSGHACSRICIAAPHAQVTDRTRNSFAIDLKAESQPTLSRTDERLEKRNRSTLARQARAIRDIFASD
jgi:hypothetical protein